MNFLIVLTAWSLVGIEETPVELWSGKFEETSVTLFARACIQKKTATPFPSEEHSRLCLRSTA